MCVVTLYFLEVLLANCSKPPVCETPLIVMYYKKPDTSAVAPSLIVSNCK